MKCKRCGYCCENLSISISPKELKENYIGWKDSIKSHESYRGIDLIYPMLRFKKYDKKNRRYIYSCVYLKRVINGDKRIAVCGIYEIRPEMCKEYGMLQKSQMNMNLCDRSKNKLLYPNCVF